MPLKKQIAALASPDFQPLAWLFGMRVTYVPDQEWLAWHILPDLRRFRSQVSETRRPLADAVAATVERIAAMARKYVTLRLDCRLDLQPAERAAAAAEIRRLLSSSDEPEGEEKGRKAFAEMLSIEPLLGVASPRSEGERRATVLRVGGRTAAQIKRQLTEDGAMDASATAAVRRWERQDARHGPVSPRFAEAADDVDAAASYLESCARAIPLLFVVAVGDEIEFNAKLPGADPRRIDEAVHLRPAVTRLDHAIRIIGIRDERGEFPPPSNEGLWTDWVHPQLPAGAQAEATELLRLARGMLFLDDNIDKPGNHRDGAWYIRVRKNAAATVREAAEQLRRLAAQLRALAISSAAPSGARDTSSRGNDTTIHTKPPVSETLPTATGVGAATVVPRTSTISIDVSKLELWLDGEAYRLKNLASARGLLAVLEAERQWFKLATICKNATRMRESWPPAIEKYIETSRGVGCRLLDHVQYARQRV